MKRAGVDVATETCGKKLGKGDVIPAFLSNRDFDRLVIGNAEAWEPRGKDRGYGPHGHQSRGRVAENGRDG